MTEREIKLRVGEGVLDEVRKRLHELDALRLLARHHEINLVLDDDQATFRTSRRLLRVRRYGDFVRCTYKGAPTVTNGVKERDEHEVTLQRGSDPDELLALLAGLGFTPSLRYDKYRESWQVEDHEVVLDQTPIGDFLEIEGPTPHRWLAALGIDQEPVEDRSYPEIWSAMREHDPNLPRDLVFSS